MTNFIDQNRRSILVGSIALVAAGKANIAYAQNIPDIENTVEYLQTPQTVALLYSNLSIMYSLTLGIYLQQNQASVSDPEKLDSLELPPLASGDFEIWNLLQRLSTDDGSAERLAIQEALKESDPLSGSQRGTQNETLIANVTNGLGEIGIDTEIQTVKEAVDSLTSAERIAAVSIDEGNESNYFCRVFPWVYFC
ncbi:hypothetical protein [Ruegeria arenilitoris]|uniref:hypothetical protein n=1 Tax=Ruegeria arenilitoris TaxID=1173585 RepID=UPI0014815FE1|nr:hypothetical protein [Ruegeria arenilitoris]